MASFGVPQKKVFSLLALSAIVLALATGYQNCSGNFEVSKSALLGSSGTVACKANPGDPATEKNETAAILKSMGPINCLSGQSYSCIVRNYSPDIATYESKAKICVNEDQTCTIAKVLDFDTRSARTPESETEFQLGGEYNRSDAQCAHVVRVNEVSIAIGDGETVEDALRNAVQACQDIQPEASGDKQ